MKLRTFLSSLCAVGCVVSAARSDGPIYWDPAAGGNGHYYQLVSGYLAPPFVRNSSVGKSWADAMWDARTAPAPADAPFGHLLAVADQAEFDFVMAAFGDSMPRGVPGNYEDVWIGFTDAAVEGRWQWIDGQGGVWEDPTLFPSPQQDAVSPWLSGQPGNGLGETVAALRGDASIGDLAAWNRLDYHLVEWQPNPPEGTKLTYTVPIAGRGNPAYTQLLTELPTPTSRGILSVWWDDGSANGIYLDNVLLAESNRDDPIVVSIDQSTLAGIFEDGEALFRFDRGSTVTVLEASLTFEYSYVPEAVTDPWEPVPIIDTRVYDGTHNTYHLLAASSWTDAQRTARTLGGHLVTLNDRGEEVWVWSTFTPGGGDVDEKLLWIGLNDADRDGEFTWASGEPVTHTNWRNGEPSANEHYVEMGHWEFPFPHTWNNLSDDNFGFKGKVFGVVEIYSGPRVVGVEVGGLSWGSDGHNMPVGSEEQLRPLPWTRINKVSLDFSEHVTLDDQVATLIDGEGNEIGLFGPVVGPGDEPGMWRATWQLEEPLASGRYRLRLGEGIVDDDGLVIDGDWINGVSVASGNGAVGGEFEFEFNVLVGDSDGSGLVHLPDLLQIRNAIGTTAGGEGYDLRYDINTNGVVDLTDVLLAGGRIFDVLPNTAAANTAAVPEPSALLLAACGFFAAMLVRQGR